MGAESCRFIYISHDTPTLISSTPNAMPTLETLRLNKSSELVYQSSGVTRWSHRRPGAALRAVRRRL